jgi:hypothetical protein
MYICQVRELSAIDQHLCPCADGRAEGFHENFIIFETGEWYFSNFCFLGSNEK